MSEINYSSERDIDFSAGADARASVAVDRVLKTHYRIEAYDKHGRLKWIEEFDNLVVNEGLDDSLDKHLKGSSYTATWYVGLTGSAPTFAAGDTMASHAGWTELTAYSETARPSLVLGTVSGQSVDNSANPATFTINANNTVIGGAFVVSDSTKGGTTGILYGGGAFTAGDKTLDSGDTLRVTVTFTVAAA